MINVQEIEQAVTRLSEKDMARFREWFAEYDAKAWDEKFERAVKAGKLDAMAEQAIADFRAGKFKEV